MLAKITRSNQITIPREIIKKARLSTESDYVDVQYSNGVITIKPVDVEERIPPEQYEKFMRWALSDEETAAEFSSYDKMMKHLKSASAK